MDARTQLKFLLTLFGFLCLWTNQGCGDGHPGYGDNLMKFTDDKFSVNGLHIREQLEDYFSVTEVDFMNMSPEQMRFYFFELHDFDKNGKIDGLEMLRAILHMIEHHNATEASPDLYSNDDKHAHDIDATLKENDLDGDGYLSYQEFVHAQEQYKVV